eukprot:TRINITY_DN9501_c0_g3_i2.p1 TRINITY_DN9501_c0_g3~~TRINITY_DN9501_c0_g3_i2.p1  ORF type:complete len:624 (+),score=148.16 TRINITY_DN9501_c0_g3_i2:90-1874(+)
MAAERPLDRLREAHRRLAEGNREVRRLLEGVESGLSAASPPQTSSVARGTRTYDYGYGYGSNRLATASPASSVGPNRYSESPAAAAPERCAADYGGGYGARGGAAAADYGAGYAARANGGGAGAGGDYAAAGGGYAPGANGAAADYGGGYGARASISPAARRDAGLSEQSPAADQWGSDSRARQHKAVSPVAPPMTSGVTALASERHFSSSRHSEHRYSYGERSGGAGAAAPAAPHGDAGVPRTDDEWNGLLSEARQLGDSPRRRWAESPRRAREEWERPLPPAARGAEPAGGARDPWGADPAPAPAGRCYDWGAEPAPSGGGARGGYGGGRERGPAGGGGSGYGGADYDRPQPGSHERRWEHRADGGDESRHSWERRREDPDGGRHLERGSEVHRSGPGHEASERRYESRYNYSSTEAAEAQGSPIVSPHMRRLAQQADSRYAAAEDAVEDMRGSPGRSASPSSAVGVPNDVGGDTVEFPVPIDVRHPPRGARYSPAFRCPNGVVFRLKWYAAGDSGQEDCVSLYYCPIEGMAQSVTVESMLDGRVVCSNSLGPQDLAAQPPSPDGRDGIGWGALLSHAELGSRQFTIRATVN